MPVAPCFFFQERRSSCVLEIPPQTIEKLFFLAGRIALASSIVRFVLLTAWRAPIMDRRLGQRVRCGLPSIRSTIVASHRRGRTGVERIEAAHLTVRRRPA